MYIPYDMLLAQLLVPFSITVIVTQTHFGQIASVLTSS